MQQGIELNILNFSDEHFEEINKGNSLKLDEIPTRIKKFYNIDNISPENGGLCRISSGGCEYISLESYSKVDKKIRKQLINIKFN